MNELALRSRWKAVLVVAALVLASAVALAASKAAEATFPGDNGKIAFFSDRMTPENSAGDFEIFTMNPDGSNIKQLTHNEALDWEPAVAPHGQRIAFFSDRYGNNEIYVMRADGTGQTRLTNNPARDQYPVFSPDGKRIIFQSDRDGNWEIYAMNADGSGTPTNLTLNPSDDGEPAFSPDGTKIAFVSWRDGLGDIYAMDPDGSNQTRLTHEGLFANYLNYSPDGTKIAFHSARDGDYDIYTVDADGSNLTNLTDTSFTTETHPAPSPDGTKIAFESFRDGNQEIYTMNWDSSNLTRLTNNPTSDAGPDWGAVKDTVPPTVLNYSPTGSTEPRNTDVSVKFSEPMNPATLSTSTVTLFKQGARRPESATVSYDSVANTVTLNPYGTSKKILARNTTYTVTVKGQAGGVTDEAGNPLASNFSWSFTTGSK